LYEIRKTRWTWIYHYEKGRKKIGMIVIRKFEDIEKEKIRYNRLGYS